MSTDPEPLFSVPFREPYTGKGDSQLGTVIPGRTQVFFLPVPILLPLLPGSQSLTWSLIYDSAPALKLAWPPKLGFQFSLKLVAQSIHLCALAFQTASLRRIFYPGGVLGSAPQGPFCGRDALRYGCDLDGGGWGDKVGV